MSAPKQSRKMTDPDRRIFDSGVREGRRQMQVVVLTYLEERYLNREVVRGSTLGKAILEVAADLAKYLKGLNNATASPLRPPQNPVTGAFTIPVPKTAKNGGAGFLKKEPDTDSAPINPAVAAIKSMTTDELREQINQRRNPKEAHNDA